MWGAHSTPNTKAQGDRTNLRISKFGKMSSPTYTYIVQDNTVDIDVQCLYAVRVGRFTYTYLKYSRENG